MVPSSTNPLNCKCHIFMSYDTVQAECTANNWEIRKFRMFFFGFVIAKKVEDCVGDENIATRL